MKPPLPVALAILMLAGAPPVVRAHAGHDHGAEPPALARPVAPRAEALSAELQLLAVVEGETLRLYLDRAPSNEPVTEARIELESGDLRAQAQAQGDGSFLVAAPALTHPGRHPLVFTIQAGDTLDLLNATLEVPAPPAAEAPGLPRAGLALGGALAAALAAGLWRRRAGGRP